MSVSRRTATQRMRTRPRHAHGRRLAVAIASALAGLVAGGAHARDANREVRFNPNFIHGDDGRQADLGKFSRGNPLLAGSHHVDAYVNGAFSGRLTIEVTEDAAGGPRYCLAPASMAVLGIDPGRLPEPDRQQAAPGADCFDLLARVPGATLEFDGGELRADLGIPQAYLQRSPRGHSAPAEWNQGVSAAFIDYNGNAFSHQSQGRRRNQAHVGLNAGVNLGAWRFRHTGSLTRADGSRTDYRAISSFAQRDLTRLRSQLAVGEYYTSSDLFDAIPFTGVRLFSDDRMLPDTQRGFAPIIRGAAQSNAVVTIRQNGTVLHEVSVAPGPFIIDDLYATGYAGDLEVTVTEADGSRRRFVVPYAAVPQLLRPGMARYSATVGRYRDERMGNAPYFAQASYQRGISNHWTGYGGVILAAEYAAVQGGGALSTPAGAFAADVTHATSGAQVPGRGGGGAGQSYRLSYSKTIEATRTNLVVAAYRFSTLGYLDFASHARMTDDPASALPRQRSRLQLNVSQPLGRFGNLHFSGSSQAYWRDGGSRDTSYQAGYGKSFHWGSLNVSANRSRTAEGGIDRQYMVNLSLPLGRSPRAPYLSGSVSRSGQGHAGLQANLTGSAGEAGQFTYGLYASRTEDAAQASRDMGANAQYRGNWGLLSANFSRGEGYRQIGLAASGSVVFHPGGVNLSQGQGETRVVIAAPGAAGARVLNAAGVKVGANGYAVVSGLMPYRYNEVALDPKGMSHHIELQVASQRVAPRHGALVMLEYPTITGRPLLLTLRDSSGGALPVGAEVRDAQGRTLALVGQGSRAFVRVEDDEARLQVRWGSDADASCDVSFALPRPATTALPFQQVEAGCQQEPPVARAPEGIGP